MADVMPDAEQLWIDFLLSQPAVTALVGDNIYTEIPENADYDLIRTSLVTTRGAAPEWRPVLQVEAWTNDRTPEDKAKANEIGRKVEAVLSNIVGPHPASGGFVIGAFMARGFGWSPDPEDQTPRYLGDVELMLYRNPA